MNKYRVIFIGALATVLFAFFLLVFVPHLQLVSVAPPAGLKAYADSELAGRREYVSLGCLYCHSQQVRAPGFGSDNARGWGRASYPEDYAYDYPHLLGTMRTGPDLMNIGGRQPSRAWHYAHLYQPRAMTPGSVMAAFPFLFAVKDQAQMGDEIVDLPAGVGPAGKVVVALPAARALVSYLLAMKHDYPAGPGAEAAAAPGGSP
ncbi:MAG TPA: cbb3-type cytochrome c oxidase subunit II [Gemmatimonadales bacterium]|nr:cbb3-type cytochrome c oxidase subunit II [Gemmatimonadales bacterium]